MQVLYIHVPTQILYGEKDQLTSLATMKNFAEKHHAGLTVMENGEHWFHIRRNRWLFLMIGFSSQNSRRLLDGYIRIW